MIEAAYPLLYAREATDDEVALGLEFLSSQKALLLEEELKELVTDEDDPAPNEGDGGTDDDPRELAERRAAMKAWVQYSRALFSAAEFRFIS